MTSGFVSRLRLPVISMVTDRHRYRDADGQARVERLIEDAGRAARAGVDLIQVRERGLDDRALLDLVRRVAAACAGSRALVVVNGRTDVALAAAADGVHLPAASPPAASVREIVAPDFLVGRSVHTVEEAVAAERAGGCDYLIFGTVYQSVSKPADHVVSGVETLRRVCDAVQLPVLGIGGILPGRAGEVAPAGAAGIAAIGMFVTTAEERAGNADELIAARVAAVRAPFDDVPPSV